MAVFAFLKQILHEFSKDKVGQLSAAFAYGAVFSIAPLLLLLISIAGFIFGEQAAQGKLFSELSGTVGASTAKTIQNVVIHTHHSSKGTLALVTGTIGSLLAAAGLTTQLQSSFNTILCVVPDPKGGIKRTIYVEVKNVALVVLGGILIAASVVASAIIIGLGNKLQQHTGLSPTLLEIINSAVSLTVFAGILYLVYRVLPDVIIPRKVALSAAFIVALLFLVGKIVLGIVIGKNGTASAYGAAASLVTLLLWVYYSGQILFIGAEGMKVYGNNHSLNYRPKRLSLKRRVFVIDSGGFGGRLVEAWVRGFKKNSR
jgi:membrane protein